MVLKVMIIGKHGHCDVYTREFAQSLADKGLSVTPFYVNKNSDIFANFLRIVMELRKSDIVHLQFYVSVFNVVTSPLILLLYTSAWLMNKKIATTIHSVHVISGRSLSNNEPVHFLSAFYSKFYVKNLVRLSDITIVHTRAAKSLIEKEYRISKVFFFPVASYKYSKIIGDPSIYLRRKYAISEKDKVLLLFGTPSPYKGFHFVIEALPEIVKKVKHVKVLIVGGTLDSNYILQLKELTTKHCVDDYVVFAGYVSEQEIPSLMAIANAVIYPYERKTFAMSGALCEAVSALKPIICTDIPAFDFLENGKTCIKIKDTDIRKGIVLSVTLLLSSEALCKELSSNLAELRKNLSIENYVEKYIQLISK